MTTLPDSTTTQNILQAWHSEVAAYHRFIYFAQIAEMEGHTEIAALFRHAANGEIAQANGLLKFLILRGDPITGLPLQSTQDCLAAVCASEKTAASETYTAMSQTARADGLPEVAEWFEAIGRASRTREKQFRLALEKLHEALSAQPAETAANKAS